ncbi:MAG TPA: WG repeat-containing protein [Chitinophagaceae bacterium]
MHAQLFPVQKDGKTGFINDKGQAVIDFEFAGASTFSEGLARVFVGDKVGFINLEGNMVIPPIYDSALGFSEGLAVVTLGEQQGYINAKGELVIAPQYYRADEFHDGLARVMESVTSKGSFINREGRILLSGRNFLISQYREGLVNCPDKGRWGFINKGGDFIIPPVYKYTRPFFEDKAAVAPKKGIDGKANSKSRYGFINKAGEMIIPPLFEGADIRFSEGLCAVWDKGFGFIDEKGAVVIPCKLDYADHFSEDLAVFKSKGRKDLYGYIDKGGNIVIPHMFSTADSFEHGLASVTVGEEYDDYHYGYINKNGEYVWEPSR